MTRNTQGLVVFLGLVGLDLFSGALPARVVKYGWFFIAILFVELWMTGIIRDGIKLANTKE